MYTRDERLHNLIDNLEKQQGSYCPRCETFLCDYEEVICLITNCPRSRDDTNTVNDYEMLDLIE